MSAPPPCVRISWACPCPPSSLASCRTLLWSGPSVGRLLPPSSASSHASSSCASTSNSWACCGPPVASRQQGVVAAAQEVYNNLTAAYTQACGVAVLCSGVTPLHRPPPCRPATTARVERAQPTAPSRSPARCAPHAGSSALVPHPSAAAAVSAGGASRIAPPIGCAPQGSRCGVTTTAVRPPRWRAPTAPTATRGKSTALTGRVR